MSTVTEVNPRLLALTRAGVSVWLDQIRRSLVECGELERMVAQECLRGVTANPSIFEKAILGSTDYDGDLESLAHEQLDAMAIYEHIAIRDVQMAADVLAEVHRQTNGRDGFVSLEVSPQLAHDTEATLAQVRSYWERIDRPNAMIKIPGTVEGVPAIEQALYEGINVNVTLLFAVSAYEAVADAYLRALERRHGDGLARDVNSVASFFVSRVDTKVDRELAELDRPDLQGKAAIANARAAYRRFKQIFDGPRWEALLRAGAAVQRPLWASTSTKDPRYPDTMYVEELVAPHIVNTMPLQTLLAVADHGEVRGSTAEQDPSADLAALAEAGIDMDQVTEELLTEGIKQFADAMRRLLAGIDERREAVVLGRPPTIRAAIPRELERPVAERVQRALAEKVAERLWRRDASLWRGAGRSRNRRPTGLADGIRDDARARTRTARIRAGVPRGRVHRRGAARDGRLVARARGDPPLLRADPRRAAPAGARLDPSRRSARPGGIPRARADAVHRLLQIGRHGRDALALPAFPRARRTGAVRRGDGPRQPVGEARQRQPLPAPLPEPAGHRRALLGAVVLRARASGADGRQRRGAASPLPGG